MLDTGDTKKGETLSINLRNSSLGGGANIHTVTVWAFSPGLFPT